MTDWTVTQSTERPGLLEILTPSYTLRLTPAQARTLAQALRAGADALEQGHAK